MDRKPAAPVPATMIEAVRHFADPGVAHDFFVSVRWPSGVACPLQCGSVKVAYMPKRRRWYCNDCKGQFTAKTRTIFEDSPIGFDKWLPAIWLIASNRNGISSCELARALGTTQKTAWFMLHRIRAAMKDDGTIDPLTGEVEADETWVGGELQHSRKARKLQRQGFKVNAFTPKTAVFGVVQRGGKARAWVVPRFSKRAVLPKLFSSVHHDATVHTDESLLYSQIDERFLFHHTVNHAIEYVNGNKHINNVEGFWSVLKRTLGGTYIHCMPKHLEAYLDEQLFRYNAREKHDAARFPLALAGAEGRRLTYEALRTRALEGEANVRFIPRSATIKPSEEG